MSGELITISDSEEESVFKTAVKNTLSLKTIPLVESKSYSYAESKRSWSSLMSRMNSGIRKSPGKSKKARIDVPKKNIVKNKRRLTKSAISQNSCKNIRDRIFRKAMEDIPVCSSELDSLRVSINDCEDFKIDESKIENLAIHPDKTVDASPKKLANIFLPLKEKKMAKALNENEMRKFLESTIANMCESDDSKEPDFPSDHFDGNIVKINNKQSQPVVAKEQKAGKTCPFYKKLPGTRFAVDAFNYGTIEGIEVYLLSHFHADHYGGLTKKFSKTIICSHSTGNLVEQKLYVESYKIRKLRLNKPYIVDNAEITLLTANHCPGSVKFLIKLFNGKTYLHTGDFRYTPDMLQNPFLHNINIDCLYLDTTYCDSRYDFPSQIFSIAEAITEVKMHLTKKPRTLIFCGSYLIGKERVYFSMAEILKTKVYVTNDKKRVINALNCRKFSDLITTTESESFLHVGSLMNVKKEFLLEYLSKRTEYTNIIGIKPSGWQFSGGLNINSRTYGGGKVTVIGVPYSEHSSFTELRDYVRALKPMKVQPTVNVGSDKKRQAMMSHIDQWLGNN